MRLRAVPTLAIAALLALAPAAPGAVLQNLGDFEDGTLGVWQQEQWTLGPGSGWVASGGPEGWITNTTGYPSNGNFQAMCDQDLYGTTTVLHRTFTVPANADSLLLRLWYVNTLPGFVSDMPTLAPGGQGQGLRIDLMNPAQPVLGMAGILATPFQTSYPGNAADTREPFTLRMSVAAWRGQSVRLRIAVVSNSGNMNAGIDDVRIEGAQYTPIVTDLPHVRDGAADWGDYDNDGDLDLVIMGNRLPAYTLEVWRYSGGTFKLAASAVGLAQGDVKWVDLDRDGDLDVIAAGRSGGGTLTQVGRNSGGTFTWSSLYVGTQGSNLALADCDADGDQDAVSMYAGIVQVLRNNGAGGVAELDFEAYNYMDSTSVWWEPSDLPGFYTQGRSMDGGPTTGHASVYYMNESDGASFPWGWAFLDGLVAGIVELGDANADGQLEKFESGRSPAAGGLTESVQSWLGLTTYPDDIPPLYQPFARWFDDDLDGDMDLVVGGNNSGTRYTRLHRWAGNALAASPDAFTALWRGACAAGDFDGDGDPDLLLSGDSTTDPLTTLYRNDIGLANAGPAAPAAGAAPSWTPHGLQLTSGTATDDHTPTPGLSYNFRAGTTPGAIDLITPDANPVTGRRRVARMGNSGLRRTYLLGWNTIGSTHAPVHWSVQAVDGSYIGGAWSAERAVSIGGPLVSVTDVPADQGGQVRVRFAASPFDVAGGHFTIASYTVWQRVDAPPAALGATGARLAPAGDDGGHATFSVGGRTFLAPAAAAAAGLPGGTWEAVATIPALQQAEYVARVSTVADSGATGAHWQVYAVTTHTSTPTVWWASPADSGKSVDNIAPGLPQGLTAAYHTGGGNALAWQPSADDDFQYFRIYRGDSPGFAVSPATLAANTAATSWHDPAHDGPGVYYKLTAVDHAGNESLAAAPGAVTAVDGGPGPVFALAAPSPSPFAGSTRLSFALPAAADATLEVFDAGGRRVRTLAHGRLAAGSHEFAWDGRDDQGAKLGAGLLFVRLRAGGQEAVRRVVSLGGAR